MNIIKSSNENVITKAAENISFRFTDIVINNNISFINTFVVTVFSQIKKGYLEIRTMGETYRFGKKNYEGIENVFIRVRDPKFWKRILFFADLGFSDSLIEDECDVNDLYSFLKVTISFLVNKLLNVNRQELENQIKFTSCLGTILRRIVNTKFSNSVENSKNNIQFHYDLSNSLFESFLDPSMTYSSAIWDFNNPLEDLETAQNRKLDMIIEKAKIKEGDHVLEIGSGWGSFAIRAVMTKGCKVTGLTLSKNQKEYMEEKIKSLGLCEKIEILLMDYRSFKPEIKFDKIISIEMIEAVGKEFMSGFFERCSNLLKEKDGILVLQAITIHEKYYDNYCRNPDFIQKYIFPGGHSPSISFLLESAIKGSNSNLVLNECKDYNLHYGKTLNVWNKKFEDNFSHLNPNQFDEKFRRIWNYYLTYCQAGFDFHCLGLFQLIFTRTNNSIFSI